MTREYVRNDSKHPDAKEASQFPSVDSAGVVSWFNVIAGTCADLLYEFHHVLADPLIQGRFDLSLCNTLKSG